MIGDEVRVLVTGSRDWDQPERIQDGLEWCVHEFQRPITVVHGGARGADQMADQIARKLGMRVEEHRAHWQEHGKAAGFVRNQSMVDLGADICLAFIRNRSGGASHCAGRAEAAGIRTYRVVS